MKSIGFKQNSAEPCMLFKKEDANLTVAVIHVDDCYIVGSNERLDKLVKDLESHGFKIKVKMDTKDYLGREVVVDKEKKKAWLGQRHIVKKMLSHFADIVGVSKLKCKMQGTPGFHFFRLHSEEDQISSEDQVIYHAGVRTLLYLSKYSRTGIANVVHELLKCMAAYKEMKQVLRFIADTKYYGLKIEPEQLSKDKFNWYMVVYTDSDWAGDKEDQHSVSQVIWYSS
jgi:hypothetical protein